LTLFFLLCPLVQQLREVLIPAANALGNLDNHTAPLQLDFLALVEIPVAVPMHVSHEIPTLVVDHDPLVECVVFESPILPSLLLPLQIVGKKTDKLEDNRTAATAAQVVCRSGPRRRDGRHFGGGEFRSIPPSLVFGRFSWRRF
jgi:hypothetical protein